MLFLFRADRLPSSGNPPGDARAHLLSAADWAGLDIAGGDHERLSVRRSGGLGRGAFENVRIERAEILKLFPPEGATPCSGRSKQAERRPTKQAAAARALARLFPSGRPPHLRDELLRALKEEPGLKSLSRTTLDRAIAKVWPLPLSDRVK